MLRNGVWKAHSFGRKQTWVAMPALPVLPGHVPRHIITPLEASVFSSVKTGPLCQPRWIAERTGTYVKCLANKSNGNKVVVIVHCSLAESNSPGGRLYPHSSATEAGRSHCRHTAPQGTVQRYRGPVCPWQSLELHYGFMGWMARQQSWEWWWRRGQVP